MYYVCFLDLLGQTDFFGAVKDNPHEKETIEQIARVSYAIESVVNYIEKSIERDLTGEAGVSLFSDSIVIWLKGNAKLGCWLRLIVKVVHIALRYQIPIRGAISCGDGIVDANGIFAGSPLLEAMDAEANFSVYPRIILVGKMRGWLDNFMEQTKSEDPRFAIDIDGHFILNYVGNVWMDDLAFKREKMNLPNIIAWVYWEYCRFCHDPENQLDYNRKNLKLTRKYLMWVDYLRRTLDLGVDDVINLPHNADARITLFGDTKWIVEQYVVFYVKIESPLVEIKDSKDWIDSDKVEKEICWSNQMAELIGAAVGDLDRSLRRVPSYSHEMEGVEVRIQRIGNYLLVYVPERHDVIKSMYALMILRNTEFFRKLASRGTFVRGAFTRGLGWELQSDQGRRTLYGPVMADSYKLMTDIAWKPRLVVEESIFKIISDRSSYGPGKDGDWLPLYVKRDFDGVGFVKYVAFDEEFARSHLKESCETIENLKKARDITRRYIQVLANRYEKCDYSEHVQRLVPLQEEFSNAVDEWSEGLKLM